MTPRSRWLPLGLLSWSRRVSAARASVIYAVLADAAAAEHFGSGMLTNAPLLESILSGGDGAEHGALVFATPVGPNAVE